MSECLHVWDVYLYESIRPVLYRIHCKLCGEQPTPEQTEAMLNENAALKRLLDAIRRECGEKHASAEYNIANILRLLDGTHFTGGTVSAYFDTHRPEER